MMFAEDFAVPFYPFREVGFSIVMSVHDEVVLEAVASASLEEVCQLMAQTPPWAKGLLLRVAGFACPFYKKE